MTYAEIERKMRALANRIGCRCTEKNRSDFEDDLLELADQLYLASAPITVEPGGARRAPVQP